MKKTRKKLGFLKKNIFEKPILPILALVVFLVLSCLRLDRSIWFDESYSANLIRGDFGQIWRMTAVDVHPPFYYFCLKVWSLIFGTSDIALRSMGVFFGTIALILAYVLLKKLFGKKIAGISSFALAISPIFVRYSQEMRMYTLVFAIVMAASLVLYYALKDKKKSMWVLYAALVSLGVWTHYFAALAWVAHLIFIVYYFREHGLDKSIFWAYPLSVLLYLPWLPTAIAQVLDVEGGFWIPAISVLTPLNFFVESFSIEALNFESCAQIFISLAALVLAIALFVQLLRRQDKKDKEKIFALLLLIFIPPLLLMLVSIPPMTPKYILRYVLYSAALLWLLVGIFYVWFSEIKVNNSQKIVRSAFLGVFVLVFGAFAIQGHEKNFAEDHASYAQEAMEFANAQESMPIYAHISSMVYYNFFFYEDAESHPISGVDTKIVWGSLQPMEEYGMNKDSNTIEDEKFIYIVSSSEDEYELGVHEQYESELLYENEEFEVYLYNMI